MTERTNETDWVTEALEMYERPLVSYAARITGDLDRARDVVQDTFLRLCRAERTKVEGHLAAWLYRVCRNRALDVRKKEARMQTMPEGTVEGFPAPTRGPRAAAVGRETHRLLLTVLGELPPDQQEAFRLKFGDELTYREISRVTGRSLGTISKLLTEALGTVRTRLRAELEPAREV